MTKRHLWEILVPTMRNPGPDGSPGKPYRLRYHRVWDDKVRAISGGLTIMPVARGQWIGPEGSLFKERMIPVRIMATRKEIDQIIQMTAEYYDQLAVLCYRVSDEVILWQKK